MNLPRFVAVVSAIVSSTAGFFVLSRWRLVGTFTGAAVVPVVYTLVSHVSSTSLNRLERWFRSRRRCAQKVDGREKPDTASKSADQVLPPENHPAALEKNLESEVVQAPPRIRSRFRAQWALAAFAVLALAVSLYSLAQASRGEKTVVRERIIEKTVTVTTVEYIYSSASAPGADGLAPTNLSQDQPDTPTTAQTVTTDQTGQDPDLSSTTTTAPNGGGGDSSSTTSPVSTTTSLP
jgi:hypothetical protein